MTEAPASAAVCRLVLSGTGDAPARELVLDASRVSVRETSALGMRAAGAALEGVRWVGTRRVHYPWLLLAFAVQCFWLFWHARTLLEAGEAGGSTLDALNDLRVWMLSVSGAIAPLLGYLLTRHVVFVVGTQRSEIATALRGDAEELADAMRLAAAVEARALEARRTRPARRPRALAALVLPELPATLGGRGARFDRQRLLALAGAALVFLVGTGGYFVVRPASADPEAWPPADLADAAPWVEGPGADPSVVYGGEGGYGDEMVDSCGGPCDLDCDGMVAGEERAGCEAPDEELGAPPAMLGLGSGGAPSAVPPLPTPPPAVALAPAHELAPTSTAASRVLVEGRSVYASDKAFDGSNDTAWAVRDAVPGEDWLEGCFGRDVSFDRLELTTGYEKIHHRSGDLFVANAHVAEAHVLVDGREVARFSAGEAERWAVVPLSGAPTGRCVRIVFDRAWPGERWQDLSISEVHVWGR